MNTQELLKEIEAELKKGSRKSQAKLDRLNKQLDQALGTTLSERDTDRESAWERGRRS